MLRIRQGVFITVLLLSRLTCDMAMAQRGPSPRMGPDGYPPGTEFSREQFGPPGPEGIRRHPGPPPPPWALPPEALERLNLTEAQRARIDALHESTKRMMIRAAADVRIAELDLDSLMQQDAPDTKVIDAAVEHVGALRLSMHKSMIAEALAVRAVLTAEQRARARKPMMDPRPSRGDGRR